MFSRATTESAPLVVGQGASRPRVLLANAAARERGVAAGMPVSAARALAPDLLALPREPTAEARALAAVADWAWQFSPQLSLRSPEAVLLEAGASLRLFGGFDALLDRVRDGLAGLGYRAVLASAPTPSGALCLARRDCEGHVQTLDELRRALLPLPLSVLDWEDDAIERLHGMGVRRLAELLRLPRDGLARRFGADLPAQLDRLLGRAPDPQPPWTPAERFERRLALPAEAVDVDGLRFALQRLLQELCGWLRGRGAATRQLDIRLRHADGAATRLSVGSARDSRDPGHFSGLLRERLERLTLAGPVREVELRVLQLAALDGRTADLFGDDRGPCLTDLPDRLRARLGGDAVHGLSAVAEHRPEYAWRRCPPGQAEQCSAGARRPLWLLPVPRRLRERDGRPWLQGRLQLQPDRERIEAGWWDGEDVRRDYFIAVDAEGSRYWVYRELDGGRRWFLHGVFE